MTTLDAPARLQADELARMLDDIFPWLNKNLPVKPDKPLTAQDVAHVGLRADEFALLPEEPQWCEHKRISFKRARGIEFWLCNLPLPPLKSCADLRGRFAWKLTANSKPLFPF